jgi:hypothetical protein
MADFLLASRNTAPFGRGASTPDKPPRGVSARIETPYVSQSSPRFDVGGRFSGWLVCGGSAAQRRRDLATANVLSETEMEYFGRAATACT